MNQIIEYQDNALAADKTTAKSVVHTSGLRVEEQHSPDYDFKGYLITNDIPANDLNAAYQALNASLKPAEDELIAGALLECRALMAHKNDGGDIDIILEAFVKRLKDYPKDAVLESLRKYPNDNKWFPTWSELQDDVEFRCKRRIELKKAIERKINERQLTQIRQGARATA